MRKSSLPVLHLHQEDTTHSKYQKSQLRAQEDIAGKQQITIILLSFKMLEKIFKSNKPTETGKQIQTDLNKHLPKNGNFITEY